MRRLFADDITTLDLSMVLTPSNMPELGLPAPDFALPDTHGNTVRRDDFADSNALLVVFWCNHCPYVKHLKPAFADFARAYPKQDLAIAAISANDIETHPEDSPAEMKKDAERFGYTFPYLYDESQDVAKAYRAACTPDFFLYGNERRLVYRGRFDASRPNKRTPVTGTDLRAAVDAVLDGRAIPDEQLPGIGCSVKWKPGNEPTG